MPHTRTRHVKTHEPTAVARLLAFLRESRKNGRPDQLSSIAEYRYDCKPDGSRDWRSRTEIRTPIYLSDIEEVVGVINRIGELIANHWEHELGDPEGLLETIENLITEVAGEDA